MTSYAGETKLLYAIQNERIEELKLMQEDPRKHMPVSTGILGLDNIISGGLPRYPFYAAIIGDAKMGKSTVGLNIAINFCINSIEPTALYMLEEINSQVADRTLAHGSNVVSRSGIFKLQLDEDHFDEMYRVANVYEDVPFYVNDSLYDQDDIFEDAKALGVKRIVVDNFQLMSKKGRFRSDREMYEASSKAFMRERKNGLTTFLISQGNEKGGSFGSTQVLKDTNICFGIQRIREDPKDKKSKWLENMRRIEVLRSRYSPMNVFCDLFFDGNHSRIFQPEDKKPESEDMIDFLDEHQPPEDIEE